MSLWISNKSLKDEQMAVCRLMNLIENETGGRVFPDPETSSIVFNHESLWIVSKTSLVPTGEKGIRGLVCVNSPNVRVVKVVKN